MSDLNVDDFYKDTAKILDALYRSFPRPLILYVSDISGEDKPDEYGVHSDRHMSCFSTLLWLADENYLRFEDSIQQEAVDQAVLSAPCFNLLSTPTGPAEFQDKHAEKRDVSLSVQTEMSRNINRLRRALKEGSSIRLRNVMAEIMHAMVYI